MARLVLAHGAGAGESHPFMVAVAEGLAAKGIQVITFDFPYMKEGRKVPDPAPKLEAAFADVVKRKGPLFVGGKSMGGRIASQALAQGMIENALGLVLLGYPLHPPGKPDRLRIAHFPGVTVPQLFVQGSRDAFGTPEELGVFTPRLGAPSTLHVIEGGDHSFRVPKRPASDVLAEIVSSIDSFIRAH